MRLALESHAESDATRIGVAADSHQNMDANAMPKNAIAVASAIALSEQAHSEARDDITFGDAFNEVWRTYPNTDDEIAAAREWFALCREGRIRRDGTPSQVAKSRTFSEVRECVAAHVASDRWNEQGKRFVPKLKSFLKNGGYLNHPPPPGSQSAPRSSRRTAGAAGEIAPGFNPLEAE
jgi:hypothetical protein